MRWSLGADGREPRLAQRRVILFFWPTRASSCEPDFYLVRRRRLFRGRSPPGAPGNFFKILDRALALRMMARARRKLAIAHLAQLPAHRLSRRCRRGTLEHPLAEVDDAPAHDAVDRGRRALLDDVRQRRALILVEARRLPRRLAIHETVRARALNSEPSRERSGASRPDLGRLAARRAVVNRRQSQEPPCLRPVLRALGQSPKRRSIKIFPQSQSQPPWRTSSGSPCQIRNQPIWESPREFASARVGIRPRSP